MDLHLDLSSRDDVVGVRNAIETALRDAVATGRLAPGGRLPSTRSLAADVGVSRGTVVQAYEQLTAEGWLDSVQGAGTFVADVPTGTRAPEPPSATTSHPAAPEPFRAGVPDLSSFPRRAWSRALTQVTRELPNAALGYGDPRGPRAVREVLASYLARVRGIVTAPDRLLITNGLAQAISLTAAALSHGGIDRVGVEDPGSDGFPRLLRTAGHRVEGIAVDRHGLVVDDLRSREARAVLVTPAHQFPTGVVLDPSRRRALAGWAAERGGVVIEDDYDAEFRYDRRPVGAFQPLAPHRTAYAGSVSKSMAPALRIGWLIVPPDLHDEVVELKATTDLASPSLDAHALGQMITDGSYDRHLRHMRSRYQHRRDLLLKVLTQHAWLRPRGIAAGLHLVAEIRHGPTAEEMVNHPHATGLGLRALADYAVRRAPTEALVLGYGALTPATERDALRDLDRLLAALDT